MNKLRVLDLFSGIGGFSLGLERTGGFETVAFCEIEEFPRKVLTKHWPNIPCFEDIRKLGKDDVAGPIDVICGGFPCQDISYAGQGEGINGKRSGLWWEFARLICEILPRFVIVENVPALLSRGMGRVLGDLAAIGYDSEWQSIPAYAAGLPHTRNRVWVVAYANGKRQLQPGWGIGNQRGRVPYGIQVPVWPLCDSEGNGTDNGFSRRMDALGNAVVPQVVEMIGYAILDACQDRNMTLE